MDVTETGKIKEEDFPEIYQNADAVAKIAQTKFLTFTRVQLWLLVASALVVLLSENINLLNTVTVYAQIASGIVVVFLVIGIALSVLLQNKDYQNTWYKSRALAESVKTMSWRFMMKADPYGYNLSGQEARANLLDDFRKLLQQNNVLASEKGIKMATSSPGVTVIMNDIRCKNTQERKIKYISDRIDDQRKWYLAKANFNQTAGENWFWTMILLQGGAILLAIIKVANPDLTWLPIDVLLVSAGATLSWAQVKKFRELAAAYTLTAQDIGLLRDGLEMVDSDNDLSKYVMDAENAFSREHTQWIARKDH